MLEVITKNQMYYRMRRIKMEKKTSKKYYAGIDVGSVSLNCVVINSDKDIVFEFPYQRHFGKTDEVLLDLVGKLFDKFGDCNIRSIAFTGNHGKTLAEKLGIFYEFETISQVSGRPSH